MPLTRKFTDVIKANLPKSGTYRRELLTEAVNSLVTGEVEIGKTMLREYINGTVGFVPLGEKLGKSSKSLMRMLSPQGNPQANNLFEIIAHLQRAEGTVLEVRALREARAPRKAA